MAHCITVQTFAAQTARLIFGFLILALLSVNSSADPLHWLTIQKGGYPGSECIPNRRVGLKAYMLGMTGTVVVTVEYPDTFKLPYTGVHDWAWPHGMTIEAAVRDDTSAAGFVPSVSVLKQLNLRYFVLRDYARTDSAWRYLGEPVPASKTNGQTEFWFHLDLNRDWVGKFLCFRAHFKSRDYGDLTSAVACSYVSAPCSGMDSSVVNIGNIVCAGDERDYNRAFAIMDSLLSTGWINRTALSWIGLYADEQHRFDDALRYFDIQFQHYGNIGASKGETVQQPSLDSRAEYERQRERILTVKAEYKRQQH